MKMAIQRRKRSSQRRKNLSSRGSSRSWRYKSAKQVWIRARMWYVVPLWSFCSLFLCHHAPSDEFISHVSISHETFTLFPQSVELLFQLTTVLPPLIPAATVFPIIRAALSSSAASLSLFLLSQRWTDLSVPFNNREAPQLFLKSLKSDPNLKDTHN